MTTTFPDCGPDPLGLYPIVERLDWVERLLDLGVTTLQLRMKHQPESLRREEVPRAIQLGREAGARLFVNDEWQLALDHGAYGVHLGQDDLPEADLDALREAGLRLGVSTHSPAEIEVANAVCPSYIAIGTVYRTTSKPMDWEPLGLDGFVRLKALCHAPVVAIGGLDLERAPELVRAGADGIAVISAIRESKDLATDVAHWKALWSAAA